MNRAVSRFLACVVVSSVVGMSPARADDGRLPVPPQDKVEDSLGLIRDAYQADYQTAKESGEPEQLIAQLRASAGQETDAVRKYALLVEAENVAAAHDNYRKAVELLDARAQLFQIDGLALKRDLLKRLAGPKVSADLDLCDQAMDTAREAMRSDRFGVASDAANLAVSIAKAIDREQKAAARKLRRTDGRNVVAPAPIGVDLVKKATALQSQVTATEKLLEQYEAAAEKARTAPDDPAANGAIGSYLCFVRGDWQAGLPALAKSNLSEFASLAAAELKLTGSSGPMDPHHAFTIAGKWWSAAESKDFSDEREAAIKDHAAGLYAAIVDRLEVALERKLASSRLRGRAPHDPGAPHPAPRPPVAGPESSGRETPIADFTYEFHQQEAFITGYRGKDTEVVIPAQIFGKPVCGLGGGGPFKDRNDLVSVIIPNTVRFISPMSFFGCSQLKSVVLPPKLEAIGYNAFQGCSSLTEVRIPATVKNMGEHGGHAFIRCHRMTAIIVDKDNPTYTSVDGVLYDKAVTTLCTCPAGKKGVLRIPPTVKVIKNYAFAGCGHLERIRIPATTTEIDDLAFVECNVPHEIVE